MTCFLCGGQHVKDFNDISHLVKDLSYSKFGTTLSETLSPFFDYITGDGGVEIVDKNWVRWRIYGEPERRAISVRNANDSETIGAGRIPFTLTLDVDWYTQGDVLAPVLNKRCNIFINSDSSAGPHGGYEYEAILMDDDEGAFIEPSYLAPGEYYIKIGSVQSWEKIGKFGSIQFGSQFTYIEFEVPMTTMGWEFKVEGEAHRQWGRLKIARVEDNPRPGDEITQTGKISNFLEGKAMNQIDFEKEMFLAFGSKSEHLIDPNTSKAITTGPSLFEFLEEGNIIPYSPNSNALDMIVDQAKGFWFDKVPHAERRLLLYTGEGGMELFSDWIEERFGNTAASIDHSFFLGNKDPYDATGGRPGFKFRKPQFTEYQLGTFGSIVVAHWPLLDNTRINGVTYPGKRYPVSSYEFIAFNLGFGEPNVKLLARTDNRYTGYTPGFWSPLGVTGPDNPLFKFPAIQEDAYLWAHRESFGLVLMDPSCVIRFVPNVSY